MQLFRFNDQDKKIYNLDHVVKIQKYDFHTIIIETINSTDQLSYDDYNKVIEDLDSISKYTQNNAIKLKETISSGVTVLKDNVVKAVNNIKEVPIGYRFTKDFNGMINQFKVGEIAEIKYMFNAYHVIGKNGESLFRISDEASKDYGYVVYE